MTTIQKIHAALRAEANPAKALFLQKFFKTGKGEYAEGEKFLGITVPVLRKIAGTHKTATLTDIETLLHSQIHEEKFIALVLLTNLFEKSTPGEQKKIVTFYLKNTNWINNWDLVDTSADKILGIYLSDKPKDVLYTLARSKNLWERRIAIITTFRFIKQNKYEETLRIAEILLTDTHDLIHKAVGWMLREVGKRDLKTEEKFLQKYSKKMPRTMLRYAIEKFPPEKRKMYLRKESH